jgi:hypothetical protein
VNERLMGKIARQRRLADAIRADEYGIGGILEEADLAWATTRRSHGRSRADCCNDDQSWPEKSRARSIP